MRNSLKHFREQKRLTQAQLAARIGFKPQTVASYEQYTRPLPEDFARRAAVVLGVTEEVLQSVPSGQARDEGGEGYHVPTIDADVLPPEILKQIQDYLGPRLPQSQPGEQMKIAHALMTVTRELARQRGRTAERQVILQKPASSATPSDAGAIVSATAAQHGSGGSEGSSPPSVAGGPGAPGPEPPRPSSREAKPRRPAGAAKGQT